jgi:pyruvate oxidase
VDFYNFKYYIKYISGEKRGELSQLSQWRCTVCNWIFNEEKEGMKFEELPADWVCPICSAPPSAFVKLGVEVVPFKEGEHRTCVAERMVKQFVALGINCIYGIPGDSNLPLVDALRKEDKIQFVLTRHEETAAFMASAHGKLTGEVGVCLSIAGPGTTNLMTGLVDAATDGAPVLALLGQIPQVFLGSEFIQEIDEIELFHPISVYAETIAKPAQAINLTMLAVKNALINRGVSVLSLPTDILAEDLADEIWKPEEHLFEQRIVPTDDDVEKAAKIIDEYKRPVILAGWGTRKDASKELLEFAKKISAPIATTSRAKGVIPETHELAVGVLGSIGTKYAATAMKEADLCIVIGSGFRQRNLVPDKPIVQIDIDGTRLGKWFPIRAGLIGDAKAVLKKLTEKVSTKIPDTAYFEKIKRIREEHFVELEEHKRNMSVPIFPGLVIQTIQKHADKNAIICVDVGDHTYWFYKHFICDGQETLMSSNMASMGFGLPAALVSKIDFPDKQVICVTGDGGFAMVMADFTTAVRDNLPIKVILFNDSKLKNIKKEQHFYGYPEYGTTFINPNFSDFAVSCGGEGYRVEKPEELDKAIELAFNSPKPAIVDILIDPEAFASIIKKAK